ncbi:MAG: MFS transporter, partial [Cucumibacter sp.]
LIGTAIVALGTWPALHLFAAVPVMAVAASYLIGPMQESPPRPHVGEGKVRRFVLPTSATLLLIAFAFGSIWLEAAARSWSVIYLRDVFHTANWVATLTLPVCLGAQVVGRLLGDRWIERFGPVRVAMVLTAVSFVGLVLVVLGISVPVSLFGFVLIGVGFATAFPQTLSAAARLGDRPAAENLASIQQMNTIVLFLAPPVMGFTASQWGMQVSFALILPLLVVAFVLALNLAERRPPPLRRSPPAPDPY